MKIGDYIERCRLARPFLAGTPREIPILAECDLWWWLLLDEYAGDQAQCFFERDDAERACRDDGAGLIDEPRHIRDPIRWRIEHRFDDGVSVVSGLPSEGRWTNTRELFLRAERWVPCVDERLRFWETSILSGEEPEHGVRHRPRPELLQRRGVASTDRGREAADASHGT